MQLLPLVVSQIFTARFCLKIWTTAPRNLHFIRHWRRSDFSIPHGDGNILPFFTFSSSTEAIHAPHGDGNLVHLCRITFCKLMQLLPLAVTRIFSAKVFASKFGTAAPRFLPFICRRQRVKISIPHGDGNSRPKPCLATASRCSLLHSHFLLRGLLRKKKFIISHAESKRS